LARSKELDQAPDRSLRSGSRGARLLRSVTSRRLVAPRTIQNALRLPSIQNSRLPVVSRLFARRNRSTRRGAKRPPQPKASIPFGSTKPSPSIRSRSALRAASRGSANRPRPRPWSSRRYAPASSSDAAARRDTERRSRRGS